MVTDTAKGSYRKLIVRNGKLQGAVVVGPLSSLGTISRLYERQATLPGDRLSLLAPTSTAPAPVSSPALMPIATTVCKCNGVSKGAIQTAVLSGARSVAAVAQATRATTGCGGCADIVAGIVEWVAAADGETGDSAGNSAANSAGNSAGNSAEAAQLPARGRGLTRSDA
jgi:assimilatory nitrate reductase electron transfer subunit